MPELILHHYPLSPFAEKIRLILGFKKLPWHSVFIPNMMPKPDVVALTGGHRRTPFLQIGSDIYCDTALMARVLERLYPARPALPPALAGAASLIEDWADHRLFMQTVPPTVVRCAPSLRLAQSLALLCALPLRSLVLTARLRLATTHRHLAALGWLRLSHTPPPAVARFPPRRQGDGV
jgi:glutathione S-transferase